MDKEINKITIGFSFTDSDGYTSKAENTVPVFDESGDTELSVLFEEFQRFLNYLGYAGFDKEYLFGESVTGEEYEYLENCLEAFRNRNSNDEA